MGDHEGSGGVAGVRTPRPHAGKDPPGYSCTPAPCPGCSAPGPIARRPTPGRTVSSSHRNPIDTFFRMRQYCPGEGFLPAGAGDPDGEDMLLTALLAPVAPL